MKEERYHSTLASAVDRRRAYGNSGPLNGVAVKLCIGCATRHHSFRATQGWEPGNELFFETNLREAWIDGTRYRLVHYIGARDVCGECNRTAERLYRTAG